MGYPWKFYEKCVGMWVIESERSIFRFPLKSGETDMDSVAREFFHYFDDVSLALRDLFTITAVEYPPGEIVAESPMPLDLFEAKDKLLKAWKKDLSACDEWAPGVVLRGLTDVAVQVDNKIASAGLPDVLRAMLTGVPGSGRYALAIVTNCDIWLEKPISGGDNATMGKVNALKLEYAIHKAVDRLDGKVAYFATEFDGVHISESGFSVR